MPDRLDRDHARERDPLRVAILARSVHPLHGVGGLERHVYDLVRHLIARDAHVTLITKPPTAAVRDSKENSAAAASDEGAARSDSAGANATVAVDAFGVPADRFRLLTVPYITFPGAGQRGTTVADRITAYPFFGWRAGRVAAKLAYSNAIDIVYGLGASGLGYAQARRRHVPTKPFVFNPQGLEEFGATDPDRARLKTIAYGPLQSAVRSCARAADAVIATDHALVPTVLQHLPITPDHVVVVPNGIDVAAIDALRTRAAATGAADSLRVRHNIPREAMLLVSVGRLEANKGFHVLAQALARLLHETDWRWTLIGDGPFRPEIERVAQASGLASRMIVPGRVPDEELHAWYDAADLFVHPTLYEGSSLVTLEAMAHGRPIIATRAGGLPDKVTPGDNGWLVDPDRPDHLAEAISDALHRSPAARAAMGHASRARVERDFAWPVIAGQMIDLYRRLIALEERS